MPGRAVAETMKRKQPVGYDDVHSLVDGHSPLAYSEVLGDEKATTCAGFLTRAATYFAAHGITRIERLMTDNAWAYTHSLRVVCARLGAPSSPTTPPMSTSSVKPPGWVSCVVAAESRSAGGYDAATPGRAPHR